MILRDKIIFSTLSILAIAFFLGSISSILSPFIAAIIIAYFLDPLVDKLEAKNLSRPLSSIIIVSIFMLTILIVSFLIIPIFYEELIRLLKAIPSYSSTFLTNIYPKIVEFLQENGYNVDPDFVHYLSEENLSKLLGVSNNLAQNLVKSSISIINILSLIFITPILAFYLLKDWNILVNNVDEFLPSKYDNKLRDIFTKIDKVLSGYIRGQFNVCLILGIIYGFGLMSIGLNFGFLIGFFTGIISFIPYVGMLIGVLISITIAFFQWGFEPSNLAQLLVIFIIGQIIESNFLTPKLVGKKIGLHPVWVIFAIFVFGVLMGFIGILLAVPIAAILGVIIKALSQEYKKNYTK